MLYRRGEVWWFKFRFDGRTIRESAKTSSKTIARAAELKRHREHEEAYHGLKKRVPQKTLKAASEEWLELKRPTLAAKTFKIEQTNLGHLLPVLGQKLLTDIAPEDISRYQQIRLKERARPRDVKPTSPKTVNLEIGTLRSILRRHRLWAQLQPDVRMLKTRDDVGKALTPKEEQSLLNACANSRSRSLLPAVLLSLNTGLRSEELRLLTWAQVDLANRTVRVGKSKTEAGAGRTVPLNNRALEIMKFWADQFPELECADFVFPSERYGAGGDAFDRVVFATDPKKPIGPFKDAWDTAREAAGIDIRFHDLRHTFVTRMLEGGVPLSVVASLLGWSPATTARMAKRYGHIGQLAQRQAVSILDVKKTRRKKGASVTTRLVVNGGTGKELR